MNISELRQRVCKHAGDHRHSAGQTLVEYGLLIALIAIVVIIVVSALGGSVTGIFGNGSLNGSSSAPSGNGDTQVTAPAFAFDTTSAVDADGVAQVTYTASGSAPITAFLVQSDVDSVGGASGTFSATCNSSVSLLAYVNGDFTTFIGERYYTVDCGAGVLITASSVDLTATVSDDGSNMTVSLNGSIPAGSSFYGFDIYDAGDNWMDGSEGASPSAEFVVSCSDIQSGLSYRIEFSAFQDSEWNGRAGATSIVLPLCGN